MLKVGHVYALFMFKPLTYPFVAIQTDWGKGKAFEVSHYV